MRPGCRIVRLTPGNANGDCIFRGVDDGMTLIDNNGIAPSRLFVGNEAGRINLLNHRSMIILSRIRDLAFRSPSRIVKPLGGCLTDNHCGQTNFTSVADSYSLIVLTGVRLSTCLRPQGPSRLITSLPTFFNRATFLSHFTNVIPN